MKLGVSSEDLQDPLFVAWLCVYSPAAIKSAAGNANPKLGVKLP
jgi:hypothetical protein